MGGGISQSTFGKLSGDTADVGDPPGRQGPSSYLARPVAAGRKGGCP